MKRCLRRADRCTVIEPGCRRWPTLPSETRAKASWNQRQFTASAGGLFKEQTSGETGPGTLKTRTPTKVRVRCVQNGGRQIERVAGVGRRLRRGQREGVMDRKS